MPLSDDIREFKPGLVYRDRDESTQYWIRDGKIYFLGYQVRGAHVPSFRFYLGSFAKDRKNCYCTKTRLSGGNGETFRALNFCYATDGEHVWTMGGKIKDVDTESFVVCDDGVRHLDWHRVPHGFGKDRDRVYYYDHQGKTKWVRKADRESFQSLNDGFYAKDKNSVFCRASVIRGADVAQWHKLSELYSRDDRHVYYDGRHLADADPASFEVVAAVSYYQLAKDKHHFYWCAKAVTGEEFNSWLAKKNSTD